MASKMEIQEEQATTKDGPKCSESKKDFLDWVDKNWRDIEAHSGWIDKQYTQCEDFIIHPELESFEDYETLYPSAIKGEWGKVLEICRKDMFLSTAPIINSLDTLFHLAAYDKLENKFEQLLQLLPQESTQIASALRRKNKKGNNPLHIAASVGNVKVCSLIIGISKSMINTYNNEGESPLFVAALHGRKEAFLYLHSECGPHEDYCIRKNGDTILHCAIAEEHFELCYKILGLYGDLVDFTNDKRITPLHLLANKPSAFKSGNDLRWFENIIYNSIGGIEEQELINEAEKKHLRSQDILGGRHQGSNGALWDKLQLPPYYRTCFEFVKLVFQAVPSIFRKTTRKEVDIENSVRPDDVTHAGAPKMVKKLRMMKVRNKWSILIMNELLKNTSMYRFSKDRPLLSSHVPMIHEHAKSEKVDEQSPYNVINAEFNLTEKYLRILSSLNKDHGKDTKEPVKSSQLVMPEQEEKKKKEDSDQSKATNAQDSTKKKKKKSRQKDIDLSELTPILVAAKNGITEIVKATLKRYPMAMYDVDKNQKNIVLLTAEYRQPCVYELLLSLKVEKSIIESIFDEVDNEGNSALHLAAKSKDFIWPVPGALSQMQWEIKWYEYIKKSLLQRSFPFLSNNKSQTPEEVFTKNHQKLVEQGRNWLNNTSNACSVVAGLFVTSTFSTATNTPEGFESKVNESSKIYACSSFVSFYSSLIAVVMFLAIPTSGCRERDFHHALPLKLLLGLTAFYISIASTLVSFTTGHFFIFRNQLKFVSSTSYIVTNVLVTVSSMAVFPLYFHLVWATFKKVPHRKYMVNIPCRFWKIN